MKYALVTGSTKGIGRAVAEKLLKDGYYVFINYAHDDKEAEMLSKELNELGQNLFCLIKADLSVYDNISTVVDKVLSVTSQIDVVVINAGITDRSCYLDVTWESWNKVMNVNLNVPFFIIQKLSPYMVSSGSIVLIGSVLGRVPHATSYAYGVSKAGIHFLAKELVKAFADKEVRVNAICPGFTNTPWQKGKGQDVKERIESKIALKRFAEAEEIADMCCAVINNSYVNGSVIDINGGYSYE